MIEINKNIGWSQNFLFCLLLPACWCCLSRRTCWPSPRGPRGPWRWCLSLPWSGCRGGSGHDPLCCPHINLSYKQISYFLVSWIQQKPQHRNQLKFPSSLSLPLWDNCHLRECPDRRPGDPSLWPPATPSRHCSLRSSVVCCPSNDRNDWRPFPSYCKTCEVHHIIITGLSQPPEVRRSQYLLNLSPGGDGEDESKAPDYSKSDGKIVWCLDKKLLTLDNNLSVCQSLSVQLAVNRLPHLNRNRYEDCLPWSQQQKCRTQGCIIFQFK